VSIQRQILVACVAATAGLLALAVTWLALEAAIDGAELGFREVAIGTLAYATVYVLTVPRAERWLGTRDSDGDEPVTT